MMTKTVSLTVKLMHQQNQATTAATQRKESERTPPPRSGAGRGKPLLMDNGDGSMFEVGYENNFRKVGRN